MGKLVFFNGSFLDENKAAVSLFDFGFLYGDGIFETIRSYNGFIFKLEEHLTRLNQSAVQLFIPVPYGLKTMKSLCYKTLKRNNLKNASLRITLTRGVGKGRFDPLSCKKPTFLITAQPFTGYPENFYQQGIKALILTRKKILTENQISGIKSCNYQAHVLAKIEVTRQNLIEGLFLNQKGHIVEGITSNIFIIKNKTLLTPSLNSGCLNGITRNTVIELAKKKFNLPVREANLSSREFSSAQECFLTNSLMELIPVVQVGKKKIGDGKPGKMTRQLLKTYRILIRNDLKEFSGKGK